MERLRLLRYNTQRLQNEPRLQVLYSDSALEKVLYSDKSCGQSEQRKFRELACSWTLHSRVGRLQSVARFGSRVCRRARRSNRKLA
jgi:hypothetical protein